jgi:hypothetical protein
MKTITSLSEYLFDYMRTEKDRVGMPEDMAFQERTEPPSENWAQFNIESEQIYDIRY